MKFIGFAREVESLAWAREKLGAKAQGFCRAVAAVEGEEFKCVMVLSNFGGGNVDVHVAAIPGARWATPNEFVKMFNFVLHYVFDDLNAIRATALIKEGNTKAEDFVLKLGFTQEGLMRKAFNGTNLCIYGILKEDFRNHKWYRSQ